MHANIKLKCLDDNVLLISGQLGFKMHLVSFIVDTGSIATIVSLDTVQRAGLVGFIDESVDVTLAQDVCEYIPTALGQLIKGPTRTCRR